MSESDKYPHSLEAEEAALGSVFVKGSALDELAAVLEPGDFYRPANRAVYEAMLSLRDDGKPVDFVTMTDRLRQRGDYDKAGGVLGVTALANAVPTASNAGYYAAIVKEQSTRRKLLRLGEAIGDWTGDGADAAIDELEQRLLKIQADSGGNDTAAVKDTIMARISEAELRCARQGELSGTPTGFASLDWLTSGLQPGDLILLAARPSMGKTAFALNLAANVAAGGRRLPVLLFSLEMSKEQLVDRLLSMESGVEAAKFRRGNLTDGDWGDIVDAAERLYDAPLHLDDAAGSTVAAVRAKARKLQRRLAAEGRALALVVIDYLQLMQGRRKSRDDNRQQEISDISRSLKALARELNVPVVALSQLSRAVEQRMNKRPMLSDLRESGSLEQDADLVMFLYREDYYKQEDGDGISPTELILGKHRNGATGTVRLNFRKAASRFIEAAQRDDGDATEKEA